METYETITICRESNILTVPGTWLMSSALAPGLRSGKSEMSSFPGVRLQPMVTIDYKGSTLLPSCIPLSGCCSMIWYFCW